MNSPSIGRRIWYWPRPDERKISDSSQPFDAGIVYIWSDTLVNLAVKDEFGNDVLGKTSITLRQRPDEARPGECSWMQYHVETDKAK